MNARRVVAVVLPPLVLGVAAVAAWELLVQLLDLKPYFLPSPSSIADAFSGNVDRIWSAVRV